MSKKIKIAGLELLDKKNGVLIEKIRTVMIDYVYNSDEKPMKNFSVILSEKLNHSYGYLANFFSEVEATTIEQYLISLKIERIKELILFDEATLSEIAYKLHYSSVAHLSTQFKKATGLTPTHFKQLKEKRRMTIQNRQMKKSIIRIEADKLKTCSKPSVFLITAETSTAPNDPVNTAFKINMASSILVCRMIPA